MKLFLLLILCASAGWSKTKVAWVFSDPKLCKTELCLNGTFKKGKRVLLLSKDSDKTCTAKIKENFQVTYEPGAFAASSLTGLAKCKLNLKKIFLGVLDKTKANYKIFSSKSIAGEDLEKIDKGLKKDIFFSRSWRKDVFHPEGNKDRVAYVVADFKRMVSEGFEFKIKKEHLKILRQKFTDGSNSGILFAQYMGTWSAVSSTFSVGIPFVFMVDKRLLVASQVTCQLPCGYLDNEVYEFNGRKFKLIYNNADLST
jgi:hypothetical protein